ncbi:MAG: 5-bromo-4-chloroindolyl phosphate hydrolysis family protein [Faecalibacterium sp.]
MNEREYKNDQVLNLDESQALDQAVASQENQAFAQVIASQERKEAEQLAAAQAKQAVAQTVAAQAEAQTELDTQTANAIQQDLENQLRMFGASVAGGVAKGLETGEEIASQAKIVGASFATSVGKEFETASKKQWSNTAKVRPGIALEKAASSRTGLGMAQTVLGGLLGGSFIVTALICSLIGLITPLGKIVLFVTALGFVLGSLPLLYIVSCGRKNLAFSKRIKRYATAMGKEESISLADLSEDCGYPTQAVLADIRTMIKNNWAPVWFDENGQTIYLSQDAYRAAKGQAKAVSVAQATETVQGEKAGENNLLQSISSFIVVLGKQKTIMQEEDAVQELDHMQKTCGDIYDWLKMHPESAPRMRRFTNYYMPTTMKLLYSYNDVHAQQGENAQNIRRDIGRFLHTLNTAFDNLHDSLLSSVSLDVSAEISALKGMLAQDGLSAQDDFGAVVNLEL